MKIKPRIPRYADANTLAKSIVDAATGHEQAEQPIDPEQAAFIEMRRKGGLKGGKARARKLSKKQRAAIAKKAARARWGS